jgi:hypothetical protein
MALVFTSCIWFSPVRVLVADRLSIPENLLRRSEIFLTERSTRASNKTSPLVTTQLIPDGFDRLYRGLYSRQNYGMSMAG